MDYPRFGVVMFCVVYRDSIRVDSVFVGGGIDTVGVVGGLLCGARLSFGVWG